MYKVSWDLLLFIKYLFLKDSSPRGKSTKELGHLEYDHIADDAWSVFSPDLSSFSRILVLLCQTTPLGLPGFNHKTAASSENP